MVDTFDHGVADDFADGGSCLSAELRTVGSTSVLRLLGAVRGGTVAALEAQVDQIDCIASRDVVVDLARVTEIDSIGSGVLFGLAYVVRARGGRLTMIGAKGRVARALANAPFPGSPTTAGEASVTAPIPSPDRHSSSARTSLQSEGEPS